MRTYLGTLETFKTLPQHIKNEVFRKLGGYSEATIDYGCATYWFEKETLKKQYAKEIEREEKRYDNECENANWNDLCD